MSAAVRIALGLVLLLAAGLKAHHLATAPVIESSFLASRWAQLIHVEYELIVGLWLMSGLCRRWSWTVATFTFSVLAVVALVQALRGQPSCGCFGDAVRVSPWAMLVVDSLAVIALIWFRPSGHPPPTAAMAYRAGICSVVFVVGSGITLVAVWNAPRTVIANGMIHGSGKSVLLDPQAWIGDRFPLLDHVDIRRSLQHGQWEVWLYRDNCPRCHVLLTERLRRHVPEELLATLKLPPHGNHAPKYEAIPGVMRGTVSDAYDWFVDTPITLTLSEGVVHAVNASP